MGPPRFPRRIIAVGTASALIAACTVQLVAPYDSDLQQKASAMQAEAATWDLTMRAAAGTIAADPRNPGVSAMLNKWRGEADAMLTLAISNDTGIAQCSQAVKAVAAGIEAGIPPSLLAAAPPAAPAGNAGAATPAGCEAQIVANIATDIDDIATVLKYCHVDWVPDSYFAALAQNSAAAPKPPAAPDNAKQLALHNSCGFEFKPRSQAPSSAAEAGHGQAASALLLTLQEIVYLENRKKTTTTSK